MEHCKPATPYSIRLRLQGAQKRKRAKRPPVNLNFLAELMEHEPATPVLHAVELERNAYVEKHEESAWHAALGNTSHAE